MGHFYRPDFFLERLWLPMFWGNRKHPKFCSNLLPIQLCWLNFNPATCSSRFPWDFFIFLRVPGMCRIIRTALGHPGRKSGLLGCGIGHVGLDSPAKRPFFLFFAWCFLGRVILGRAWHGIFLGHVNCIEMFYVLKPAAVKTWNLGPDRFSHLHERILSWRHVTDEEDIRSTGFSTALHEELVFLTAPKWEIMRNFQGDMFDTMDTLWSVNYREVPENTRDITLPLRSLAYPLKMTGWKTILSFEGPGNFFFGPC